MHMSIHPIRRIKSDRIRALAEQLELTERECLLLDQAYRPSLGRSRAYRVVWVTASVIACVVAMAAFGASALLLSMVFVAYLAISALEKTSYQFAINADKALIRKLADAHRASAQRSEPEPHDASTRVAA